MSEDLIELIEPCVFNEQLFRVVLPSLTGSAPRVERWGGSAWQKTDIATVDDLSAAPLANGSWLRAFGVPYEDWPFGRRPGPDTRPIPGLSPEEREAREAKRKRWEEERKAEHKRSGQVIEARRVYVSPHLELNELGLQEREIRAAAIKATQDAGLSVSELTRKALTEWLETHGYLKR